MTIQEAEQKRVLDACCGSRMFWFDKHNSDAVFTDNRTIHTRLCDGRLLDIEPDIVCDFTCLPFNDNTFYHVVFDPPHLKTLGENSWMAKKYGTLKGVDWKSLIHDGFNECMRVLKPNGTLIFKWNEQEITVKEVINAIGGVQPLYGHKSGKLQKTHWMAFIKTEPNSSEIPNNSQTCANCKFDHEEWFEEACDSCCDAHSNWQPKTDGYMNEEQTEDYRKMLDKAVYDKWGNVFDARADIEDEPQKCYLRKSCDHYGDKQVCGRCREYNLYSNTKTEPQTDCAWGKGEK